MTDEAPVDRPSRWSRPAAVVRAVARHLLRRDPAERPHLTYTPIGELHERYTLAPPLFDAPHVLRARIDELAATGALDEGSAHVFEPTISSWVEQWCDQVQDEYDDRLVELQLREAEAQADAERRQYLADFMDRQLREAEERLQRLRGETPTAPRQRRGSAKDDRRHRD